MKNRQNEKQNKISLFIIFILNKYIFRKRKPSRSKKSIREKFLSLHKYLTPENLFNFGIVSGAVFYLKQFYDNFSFLDKNIEQQSQITKNIFIKDILANMKRNLQKMEPNEKKN